MSHEKKMKISKRAYAEMYGPTVGDKVRLAEKIMTTFLGQALRDGYFHADMHQGNLKVASDGTLVALDFGIMGRIDEYTRQVYAEILFGFIRKDYKRVAEVHFEAGYVPANQDVDEFARALRAVGESAATADAAGTSVVKIRLIAVAIGGLAELIPLMLVDSNVPTIETVKPYTPLELEGRDIYIREGCVSCHSQMVRPMRDEIERYGNPLGQPL